MEWIESEHVQVVDGMKPLKPRSMYLTFLGAVVRRLGGWTPIAGTVELMGQLGLDAPSVRTSVSRLKSRGWLKPETRHGARGYLLSPDALEVLAAGDEVIWHARQNADLKDGWCIVNFSVPESDRSRRHRLRTNLGALGFGNVGAGVWIAPARMLPAATKALDELRLTELASMFVGHYSGGQDLRTVVQNGWDLEGLNHGYHDFIRSHRPTVERLEASPWITGEEAFATYMTAVDHWRRLPFRDPGLPTELLGKQWAAPDAAALFEQVVELLEGRALSHASQYWPVTDASIALASG